MKETICTIAGLIGGFIAAIFGGWDSALVTLVIFMQNLLTDCTEIDEKQQAVLQEMEVVSELTRKYIMENSLTA